MSLWRLNSQRTIDGKMSFASHIDLPVDDGGHNELCSCSQRVPAAGLVAVVELLGDVGGVVSVQCGRVVEVHGPNNTVGRTARGHYRLRAWKRIEERAFGSRRRGQQAAGSIKAEVHRPFKTNGVKTDKESIDAAPVATRRENAGPRSNPP